MTGSQEHLTNLSILLFLFVCPLGAFGETLYNGIVLPDEWPPRRNEIPTREPMPVPYLNEIPEVIPVDIGRQLFVDDFLIEPCTLKRTYHCAEYHEASPVLKPDASWETDGFSKGYPAPTAMVFSDGVWYDPADRLFKMWYMGGYGKSTCYATSTDGIRWEKPELDVVPGTNVVNPRPRDSNTVWFDLLEEDPGKRFKMFASHGTSDEDLGLEVFFSPDGIHWGDMVAKSGRMGDRSTVFFNPFRNVWVYSIKDNFFDRRRRYREHSDVLEGARWKHREPPLWVGADRLDRWLPEYDLHPQLYNLDAVAYESLMLGLFTIWHGGGGNDRPKPNDLYVAFSRDGFHWHRSHRKPFVPISERPGDWNYGNVQSAGGCCLVVGDKLYFYVSGRSGLPGSGSRTSGTSCTGLATLRRDGFVSMDAGEKEARITTRPIRFNGNRLFVNVDAGQGELRAEVLDLDRKPIPPFTYENCVPIQKDTTIQQVEWEGAPDLTEFAGKPIRLRFYLRNGSMYSFWVSPDETGASHGYVAAGGPGFTEIRDTVGMGRY